MPKVSSKNNILLNAIIESIQSIKGNDLISLNFGKIENSICDFFVICSGTSSTHVKAIEENVKLAEESCNKLTQNINEDGELVGVDGTNTSEKNLQSSQVSSADIRKELFEGDNILTSKKK